MNGGFLIISILFVLDIIEESREDNLRFQAVHKNTPTQEVTRADPKTGKIFLKNCERFKLTSREVEVVILIGEGLKYKKIAERLFISEKTVSKHAQNMFLKTGAINKVDLINALIRNDIGNQSDSLV